MNSIDLKKMFAEGLKLFNSKRYEQAFKKFKEILALSPNNINTLVILSQLCKKKNDFHQYEFYLKKTTFSKIFEKSPAPVLSFRGR